MNKDIFIALCDHLEREVPELRWIDEDEGQLAIVPGARPPVDFPCCLLDIQYSSCRDITDTEQVVSPTVTLRVAFLACGDTNSKVPGPLRRKALERLDVVARIHACLQGWTAGDTISPMSRRSTRPSVTAAGIKVYTIIYDTTFEEY